MRSSSSARRTTTSGGSFTALARRANRPAVLRLVRATREVLRGRFTAALCFASVHPQGRTTTNSGPFRALARRANRPAVLRLVRATREVLRGRFSGLYSSSEHLSRRAFVVFFAWCSFWFFTYLITQGKSLVPKLTTPYPSCQSSNFRLTISWLM